MTGDTSKLSFVMPSMLQDSRAFAVCEWLKKQCFSGRLIIVSGSNEVESTSFNEYSFVDFYSKPSLNILEAIVFGFQSVSTEFCCYIGDDDFPTLYGMARCVSFLEQNTDYDSARGASGYVRAKPFSNMLLRHENLSLSFVARVAVCGRYDNFTNLSSNNSFSRISAIQQDYIVSQFFVIRKTLAVQIYNNQWTEFSNPYYAEVASCVAHAALARTKFLPCHFLMRGIGEHRQASKKSDFRGKIELQRYLDVLPSPANLRAKITSAVTDIDMLKTHDQVNGWKYLIYSWRMIFRRLYFVARHQPRWLSLFVRIVHSKQ